MDQDPEKPADSHRLQYLSAEQLRDWAAVASEHGAFLALRRVGEEGGKFVHAAVTARLYGSGNAGRLVIDNKWYLLNLDHLAAAIEKRPSEMPLMHYRARVRGEDLFAPVDAELADYEGADGDTAAELRIDGTTYLVFLDDLENAITDPATFDPDKYGPPYPIDVLRDPPQPE